MPRFFAQAQQQALADRRKAFAHEPNMKPAGKEPSEKPAPFINPAAGLQGAIAQMEAAAMARIKSFRGGGGAVPAKDETISPPSQLSEEILDSPTASQLREPVQPDSTDQMASASKLAALEQAASRYLYADPEGTPWHHNLRGTYFEFLSNVLDRPAALLAIATACLAIGNWDWLWFALKSLLTMQRMSTLLGFSCLLLAISGWLLRGAAFMHTQVSAFADTVPRMPHACQEMSEMLVEMKLMRHDLKSMKAKVAWLPGGE